MSWRPSFTREELAREAERLPQDPPRRAAPIQGINAVVLLDERSVYGELKLYPHNELARALADFRGTKTFTRPMVEQLKAMGMTVQIVGTNARKL